MKYFISMLIFSLVFLSISSLAHSQMLPSNVLYQIYRNELTFFENGSAIQTSRVFLKSNNQTLHNENLNVSIASPPIITNYPPDYCLFTDNNGNTQSVKGVYAHHIISPISNIDYGSGFFFQSSENLTFNTKSENEFSVHYDCYFGKYVQFEWGILNVSGGFFDVPNPDEYSIRIIIPRQKTTLLGILPLSQFDSLNWNYTGEGVFIDDNTNNDFYVKNLQINSPLKSVTITGTYGYKTDWDSIRFDIGVYVVLSSFIAEFFDFSVMLKTGRKLLLTKIIFRKKKGKPISIGG